MSKNLIINGVTYNGIESMEIPTTTGEKVTFVPEDEAGVQLPPIEGENAATASDIVAGKQAIDADGNVVEGTLYEVKSDGGYSALSDLQIQYIEGKENSFISIEPKIAIKGNVMDDLVVRSGAEISTMFPAEEFGDAGALDVLFGRTFTSKNGVKMVGSYVFDVRPYLPKLENPATSNDILLNKESIDALGNKVVGSYVPLELPNLTNPATAADIVSGKQAIDESGNVMEGTVKESAGSVVVDGQEAIYYDDMGNPSAFGFFVEDTLVRQGDTVEFPLPLGWFGSAKRSHVLEGEFFSSETGICVPGTMPNNGRVNANLSFGGSCTIPEGYHDGTGVVQGAALPTLKSRAANYDIIEGMEAIDWRGNKIVGTLKMEAGIVDRGEAVESGVENGEFFTFALFDDTTAVQGGSVVRSTVPVANFGNATAEDVAAGKTFTSANGLNVVGTAQAGGGMETVNVTFTIYGPGTIYYMGADGVATLTSPYEQTVAVVKNSPVIIIYDGSTTLVLQYGSGYTQHYDNAWSYSGHSCSVLSFYEDGNVLYAES